MDNEMIERALAAASAYAQQEEEFCTKNMVMAIIKSMREPTEKMLHSTDIIYKSPEYKIIKEMYVVMIDSITND